jgi:hypothetical protein
MLGLPPAVVVLLPRAVPVQVDQRFIRKHFALPSVSSHPYYIHV